MDAYASGRFIISAVMYIQARFNIFSFLISAIKQEGIQVIAPWLFIGRVLLWCDSVQLLLKNSNSHETLAFRDSSIQYSEAKRMSDEVSILQTPLEVGNLYHQHVRTIKEGRKSREAVNTRFKPSFTVAFGFSRKIISKGPTKHDYSLVGLSIKIWACRDNTCS